MGISTNYDEIHFSTIISGFSLRMTYFQEIKPWTKTCLSIEKWWVSFGAAEKHVVVGTGDAGAGGGWWGPGYGVPEGTCQSEAKNQFQFSYGKWTGGTHALPHHAVDEVVAVTWRFDHWIWPKSHFAPLCNSTARRACYRQRQIFHEEYWGSILYRSNRHLTLVLAGWAHRN